MKTTIKDVFTSNLWIITSILQGGVNVRIDAKRRFHRSGTSDFFSGWCSEKYANRLARENYGKNLNEFGCYKY